MLARFMSIACLSFAFTQGAFAQDAYAAQTPQRALNTTIKTWTGDFDTMMKKRRIRMLIPYNRTLYYVDKGRERGLTLELARDFERYINKKYKKQLNKRPITMVVVATTRDHLIDDVVNGKGDIAAGDLTVTPERLKLVDFSVHTGLPDVSEVVVSRKGAQPPIHSIDDLSGRTVYVRKSSSYHESLLALNKKFAAAGKAPVDITFVSDELEDEDLLEMVNAGLIDTIIVQDITVSLWAPILPQLDVHYKITVRNNGKIGWAIRKNSPQLMAEINDFYKKSTLKTGVIMYRARQTLKRIKQIKNNINREEYARFEKIIAFFEKYGKQYDFDSLMLAAQGFQESQLKQETRSRSGAIGVMQVLPSTGKSLKVGDIRQTEANIHAGTKYMDILMSKYFQGAKFDEENRALFALASYNAGPGNISKMRKIAAAQGFNPNVWFDNVEIVTAAKIGIETTTYVRNIFKYYVSYKLIKERQEKQEKLKNQFKR